MKLMFLGADHEVTGSCHYIEACGKSILLDCGMEQGRDTYENQEIPVAAGRIDYVFLSHAHIDHSGLLPLLHKNGFQGQIYATEATTDLCRIMLLDSAHIQEFEAQWRNRKNKRAGKAPFEPLYTTEDAMAVMEHFVPCDYMKEIEVCEGVKIRFTDVGHLLGSSSIEIWLTENGRTDDAVVMLTSLARFFRISLSRGSSIIPIRDELEHARHYLTIQKMRYKNKFSATITAEDGVESLYTIKLIVQPILENAIYHGMAYADGDGEISVRAFRDGEDVLIEVSDNGPGMPEEVVANLLNPNGPAAAAGAKGSGIGFRNVHQRIRLTFGADYGLTILSEPDDGTTVRIRLPALDEETARRYRKEGEA